MKTQLAPIEMVVLQGTPYCNLNCSYCDLSVTSRKSRLKMPLLMIERLFRNIFQDGLCGPKVTVVWHSGEPLTLPPEYYQSAIDLIVGLRDEWAASPIQLEFDFQTNGVLINASWIAFFKENQRHMRLGVSCDGPAELHDAYRNNWGGRPTHAAVEAGMHRLSEAGIAFKVIAVVTAKTLDAPDAFFDYFAGWADRLSGFHFNILADANQAAQPGLTYVRADRARYYTFYRHLVRRAQRAAEAGGRLRIQNFTQCLQRILAQDIDFVAEASRPLRTVNLDAEGFVTSFYAGLDKSTFASAYGDQQGLALGNICDRSLLDMTQSAKFQRILADFQRSQASCRKSCAYYSLCSGGFELSQLSEHHSFDGKEITECLIIVKTLADAMLDDIAQNAEDLQAEAAPC